MLQILANHQAIELFPKTTLTVEYTSPLFYTELTRKGYNFPLQVPSSPNNRANLDHHNRIDRPAPSQPLEGSIKFGAAPLMNGELEIQHGNEQTFKFTISEDTILPDGRPLLQALEETKIRDLLPTLDVEGSVTVLPARFTFDHDPQPTTGPAYRVGFGGPAYEVFPQNGFNDITLLNMLAGLINIDYPGLAGVDSLSGQPRFYLDLERFEDEGIGSIAVLFGLTMNNIRTVADAQVQAQAEWVDLVRTDTQLASQIAYPAAYLPNFYQGNNEDWTGWTNPLWQGLENPINLDTPNEKNWRFNYVPMVRIEYVLNLLYDALGLTRDSVTLSGTTMNQLLLWSMRATDNPRQDIRYDNFGAVDTLGNYVNTGYQRTIDLALQVPDITARQLIDSLNEWYAFYLDIEGTHLTKLRKRPLIDDTSDYIDLTNSITSAYDKDPRIGSGIRLSFGTPSSESQPDATQMQDFVTQTGGTTITTAASPLEMRTVNMLHQDPAELPGTYLESRVRVPFSGMKGGNAVGLGETDSGLRFIHYAGDAPAQGGGTYRLATTETTDLLGNPLALDALTWDGPDGLYARNLEGVVDLIDGRPLTINALLGSADLLKLSRFETSGIYFNHPRGAFRGAIRKITAKMKPNDLTLQPVKLHCVDLLRE